MSYALIIGGGPDGRYTIRLDWGVARKAALLEATTLALAKIAEQMAALDIRIAEADAEEADLRAAAAAAMDASIAQQQAGGPGTPLGDTTEWEQGIAGLWQVQARNAPLRLQRKALEAARLQQLSRAAYWNGFAAEETREAWCADFTEDAAGYVALIAIPGESNLLLIAPGGRAWNAGDGTIASATKAAKLAALNTQLAAQDAALVAVQADIDAAEAEDAAIRDEFIAAQAAYLAVQSADTFIRYQRALAATFSQQSRTARLKLRKASTQAARNKTQQDIVRWSARAASDAPNWGDGLLSARELMSPEQVYFNAAILPGWQIDRPTYRWGTLTGINWDANTGTVALGSALSSAQRLNVNRVSTLADVPFDYMNSDARAFDPDSRVVVWFEQFDWTRPTIIGFLDNPRPDPPTFSGTIPPQTASEDEAFSVDLSGYWTGGKEPLEFEVVEGALPSGLSISADGILSGTPTAPGTETGIVIRCGDRYYTATNRRYDDSNAFQIEVEPAATYYDGAIDGIEWIVVDSGTRNVRIEIGSSDSLGSPPSGSRHGYLTHGYSGTGTPPATDDFIFVLYQTAYEPELWARLTIDSGDNPTSGATPGVWTSVNLPNSNASGMFAQWSISGIERREATFTIEFARDSGGTNIVATVTGSAAVENI